MIPVPGSVFASGARYNAGDEGLSRRRLLLRRVLALVVLAVLLGGGYYYWKLAPGAPRDLAALAGRIDDVRLEAAVRAALALNRHLAESQVEVLVDSPPCAARFGGADLAAWFRLGHGVVLDSANHFEGQGFKTASLRDPEERMAYAIDHLNLSYADLRAARGEKYWGKTSSADEHVKDLSVFRLITNFVWLKRLAEE